MADPEAIALIAAAQEAVTKQGDEVRALKAAKKDGNAEQGQIDAAIQKLKDMKIDLEKMVKAAGAAGDSKEAFRTAMNNALERRMFYVPSFKIYGGVAGLYDFGPPGTAVKANLLAFWRQHFVLTENMLEIECPSVTPEIVLKASGHVDRFTDLMVNDVVTKDCHRADHLLEGHLEKLLEDPMISPELRKECQNDIVRADEYTAEQLGERLKRWDIKAPDTGNDICDPYPFNLMFATSIGPSGNLKGFLRPETAQGIFVNFRDLLYYNGGKLPFAGAQIGQAFRNEIAPRAGLLRVREFTLAEIEHFVNPDDKSCPAKFATVADLEFQFYGREEQLGDEKKPTKMRLGDAVGQGKVANETLGYFIGRTYLFLTTIGINPDRLRFRQHLQHEMAHYACDCWDAEIECSYGWMECVGLADRSAFDLKAHTEMSKIDLVAFEKYDKPREEEVVEVAPVKKVLGQAMKKNAKIVGEALEALSEDEALAMKADLEAGGESKLTICTTGEEFTITAEMVNIAKVTKKVSGKSFTPSVIEPSFGIGRIIYCMWEHAFYLRDGDEQRTVFRFSPVIAPIKCTVFPLTTDKRFEVAVQEVSGLLTLAGLSNKVDSTGTSIGKRYARTDEIGVPFAVTVDHTTLENGSVTVRERDSTGQVRMPKEDVADVIRKLCNVQLTWEEVAAKYPAQAATEA